MATMLRRMETMLMSDDNGNDGDEGDGNGDDCDHNLVSQQAMMELSW